MLAYKFLTPLALLVVASSAWAVSSDGDELSDVWEATYGFSVINGVFPVGELSTADPDGDGHTNLQESIAGTDPLDASVFSIGALQSPGRFNAVTTGFPNGANVFEVLWWGSLGKYYRIELIDDLSVGAWMYLPDALGSTRVFTGEDAEIAHAVDTSSPLLGLGIGFVRVEVFDQNTFSTTLTDWEYLKFTQTFVISDLNDTDGDSINDNEDAAPFDPTVGRVSVLISSPANGSTVQ